MRIDIYPGFITFPKKLLTEGVYRNLSDSAKVNHIYLLALSNSYRRADFFQTHEQIEYIFNKSRTSIWRHLKELECFGIHSHSSKKYYQFDLSGFYQVWPDAKKYKP